MGLIDQVLAVDAAAFVDPDSMPGAEALVYTKSTGTTRNIYGNVTRDPPERIDAAGNVFRPKLIIDVINSTTTGIGANEIDYGLDRITVAYPKGATAANRGIIGTLILHDAGMLRLELG